MNEFKSAIAHALNPAPGAARPSHPDPPGQGGRDQSQAPYTELSSAAFNSIKSYGLRKTRAAKPSPLSDSLP